MDVDIPATLYLNTSQINNNATTDVNTSNAVGSWQDYRKTFSFNVKMRQLLGNAYEKYDKFIISVVNVFMLNVAALPGNTLLELDMGGLSWVNSSYEQSTQSNNFWTTLSLHYQLATGTAFTNNTFDILSNTLVFRKGDPDVKLEFRIMDATTRAPPNFTFCPTVGMTFKIQPVVEKAK